MGCGHSKDKTKDYRIVKDTNVHVVKGEEHHGHHEPNGKPMEHRADWQEMIKNENLKEASLQHIDNGLWRDTKDEVAIYNAREAMDV